ncbi:hypothetical protein PHLGIDRAFT_224545 [Phlebiopsis gigantea 11061_1 CR5-6]|uniref:Uncharacterized protein n=1 Tax=Phlebiopsis gigantea (strain 11061_1 CR5-6) TaxID=745531 RepID=A0A0C3PEE2_PHLG1|nr:hypothetical protein PHLGIDRAFT_224545 [Phlebiopsis gigantea 11061_1 CR5-6]
MENPSSASKDNFHSFLCYASDNLPGIVIPQKVYLAYLPHEEAKDPHCVATFYKHWIAGVVVSDRPGATLGVSLAEAFDFDPKVMKWTKDTHVPSLEAVGNLSLKFALKWPGCEGFISDATLYRPKVFWTAARLAHEVARAVHKFYEQPRAGLVSSSNSVRQALSARGAAGLPARAPAGSLLCCKLRISVETLRLALEYSMKACNYVLTE